MVGCVQHVTRGWKLVTFDRKCFLRILYVFYKIMQRCVIWCCALFLSFLQKGTFFSGEVTSGNVYPFFQISACFFVAYYTLSGVTHKTGYVYLTCASRVKIVLFCPKIFFGNFIHFAKYCNSTYTDFAQYFLYFYKNGQFSSGGPSGKKTHFSQIFGCFFAVKHQIPGVTPEKCETYTPGPPRAQRDPCWSKPLLCRAVTFL